MEKRALVKDQDKARMANPKINPENAMVSYAYIFENFLSYSLCMHQVRESVSVEGLGQIWDGKSINKFRKTFNFIC